jgi:hypothetical protein
MLIDDLGLRFAEADEVDHVGEDLYESAVRGLVQVVEGEVVNAALILSALLFSRITQRWDTYFAQQFPQNNKEAHQIACVAGKDPLSIATTHVLSGGAHRRRNDLACRVHQELRQPLEDLLDDLGIGLLEVRDAKLDANVGDASSDFMVGLESVNNALIRNEAVRVPRS